MAITLSTRIGPGYITTPSFSMMTFPAGEPHIKVQNDNSDKGELTEIATISGCEAADLVTLGMWADASRQRGARTVAVMPYLPGARADRGLPFGASVYATIINGMKLDRVVCFDPHSPVMPGLLNNLTIVDSASVIRREVIGRADSDRHAQRFAGIIAPDAGAVDRASRVATATHLPLYRALKHRNPDTGKLSGFSCDPLPATGRFLVVDDICDGGGTFMGLAEATGLPRERLGLWVSHGVFSGRAPALADHYSEIWTSDSYPPQNPPAGLTIVPLDRYLNGALA